MGGMFFTLFCSAVIIKFYMIMNVYLKTLPLDPWVQSFILLIMAFAVIDGPNIIERCIGVDVGLSSVFRTTAAIFAGTRTATHMVKSAVGSVGKVASGAESATKRRKPWHRPVHGWVGLQAHETGGTKVEIEASPDSAGESRKVTRDTGGMKEASPPVCRNPHFRNQRRNQFRPGTRQQNRRKQNLGRPQYGGKRKTGYWGFCCGGETDSTASPAFSETTGTAASSGSRDLGGIEDKKSNEILKPQALHSKSLHGKKAGSSLHGSSAEYFPNTSVSKTRDGLNSGNSIKDSPYSAGGISENVTAREKTLPPSIPRLYPPAPHHCRKLPRWL